jgi:predicted nucleic acid-binding protein
MDGLMVAKKPARAKPLANHQRSKKPTKALLFKLYTSPEAERAALNEDAEAARARWIRLAEAIEAGTLPPAIHDQISIAMVLRQRANQVKVQEPAKARGNPAFAKEAIWDRARIAVEVEAVMRERHVSQFEAAGIIADAYGRDSSDAVRKCHTELQDQARQYVDEIWPHLGAGTNSKE